MQLQLNYMLKYLFPLVFPVFTISVALSKSLLQMGEQETNGLRFFRVLLPDSFTKLMLPGDFTKQFFKHRRRETATLLSPTGKIWHVDCYKETHGVCMRGEFWQKFTVDNNLGAGYSLVFHHKGNMVFTFRAFDLSTKEITYSSVIQINDNDKIKEEEIEIVSHNAADQNTGRPTDQERQMHGTWKARFEVVIKACNISRRRCCLHIPPKFTNSCSFLKGHNEVDVQDPRGRTWSIGLFHCILSHTVYMSKGWLYFARANKLKEGSKCVFELAPQANTSRLMMTVSIHDNNTERKKTISNSSGSARFESTITDNNLKRFYMHLPVGFMKSNGLTECSEFRLRDNQGRMWVVGVACRNVPTWRACLSNGWREFSRDNRLKKGDRCVFELVADGQKNVLQVQILKDRQLKLKG